MFKYFLFPSAILFILSCANKECIRQPQIILSDQMNILLPTQSFVKVEQYVFLSDKNDPTKFSTISGYNGSGSIIKKTKEKTFILTAGHICEYHKEKETNNPHLLFQNFVISDLDMNTYSANVLKTNDDLDICILVINKILDKPTLKISKIKPVLGDKIFLLSAPKGMMGNQMLPIFDGRYDGDGISKTKKALSIFSVMVAPGSSGSPILDIDGNLISILTGQSLEEGLQNLIAVGTSYQDTFELVSDL